jgi:hypothetical protein
VSAVLCQKESGEEVEFMTTTRTSAGLDPEEVLDVRVWRRTPEATGTIQPADLLLQNTGNTRSGLLVGPKIEILYCLTHDPIGHGIDVEANDITSNPIGLNERRAASHEGIGNPDPLEIM